MESVSTAGAYSSILANLLNTQSQINQYTAETSSQLKATDLQGFAASAETLTAAQNVQTKVTGYLNNTQDTANKLSIQNVALVQLGTDASTASQAVTSAIGTNSGAGLMDSLQAAFQDSVSQLNSQYNGKYVFGGGQVNIPPVTAATMTDLTAAPSVASVFQNDQQPTTAKLNDTTTVQTGFLASNLGTPLFTALQAIQAYSDGPNGPLTGTLTTTQSAFLQSQLASLSAATTGVNTATGQNGIIQSQVAQVQTNLTSQQTTMQTMIGGIADANMAQVAVNLAQAQSAMQASAQVFASLKTYSLASLLPIS